MTEEQIKQFPTSAEEYFYKQEKDSLPWKAEVYQFFKVINFYKKAINELQKEKTMETCKEPCKLLKNACLLANKANELQEEKERLAKHILELQKDKGKLTDELTEKDKQIEKLKKTYKKQRNKRIDALQKKAAELEAQIEKMKCCGNCEWFGKSCFGNNSCNLKDWKLKE